jgi:hypothetical protein
MRNLFQQSAKSPFHISVAALVTNDKKQILCHHFKAVDLPHESEGKSDLYLMMRETLHDNESLEAGVARGLMEEYGATGTIVDYLGSIQSHFPYTFDHSVSIEKTVLYFEVKLETLDESKREKGAVESRSQLVWLNASDFLKKIAAQTSILNRTDLDDSKVIVTYMEKHDLSEL